MIAVRFPPKSLHRVTISEMLGKQVFGGSSGQLQLSLKVTVLPNSPAADNNTSSPYRSMRRSALNWRESSVPWNKTSRNSLLTLTIRKRYMYTVCLRAQLFADIIHIPRFFEVKIIG